MQTALKELRRSPRLRVVVKDLPGTLTREDGTAVFALAVNVSPQGLGITCGEQLEVDTRLVFTPGDGGAVELRVAWCDASGKRGYRIGLASLSEGSDLTQIFFAAGCLDYDFGQEQL